MDLEQLETLIDDLSVDYTYHGYRSAFMDPSGFPVSYANFKNVIQHSLKLLDEHRTYIETAFSSWADAGFYRSQAKETAEYIRKLIHYEINVNEKISELKLFDSAEDKISRGIISQGRSFVYHEQFEYCGRTDVEG